MLNKSRIITGISKSLIENDLSFGDIGLVYPHQPLRTTNGNKKPTFMSMAESQMQLKYVLGDSSFKLIRCPRGDGMSSFWLGETVVTQGLYMQVMGFNFSFYNGIRKKIDYGYDLQRPVENVSWFDALLFCNQLSRLYGYEPYYVIENVKSELVGYIYPQIKAVEAKVTFVWKSNGFRLPFYSAYHKAVDEYGHILLQSYNEIEAMASPFHNLTDFFARYGHISTFNNENSKYELEKEYEIDKHASTRDKDRTAPVAQYLPSSFGLYDTIGNVSERVQSTPQEITSWYDPKLDDTLSIISYWGSEKTIPLSTSCGSGYSRCYKEATFFNNHFPAADAMNDSGFRLARSCD